MGKQHNFKDKVSAFLPKNPSPVIFLSPPPSPVRANSCRGVHGPAFSLVPKEARRKARSGSFDAREPTSPRVSCMGQIQNLKKKKEKKKKPQEEVTPPVVSSCPKGIMKIFKKSRKGEEESVVSNQTPTEAVEKFPSFGHMKQFTSGRGVLQDFHWRAAPSS